MPAIKKWNIEHPDQILAMDETGLLDNAELHSNVQYVCAKGVNKHLEERGSNARYSVLHICSALGVTLPPITIFQGSRMRVGMLEKAPKGTKYQFQESGYFLSDFLIDVVRHMIKNHQVDIPQTAVTSDPRVWVDKDQQPHIELTPKHELGIEFCLWIMLRLIVTSKLKSLLRQTIFTLSIFLLTQLTSCK